MIWWERKILNSLYNLFEKKIIICNTCCKRNRIIQWQKIRRRSVRCGGRQGSLFWGSNTWESWRHKGASRAEKEQGAGRGASRRKMRHEHRCWSRKIRKKVSAKWAGNLQPFLSCMSWISNKQCFLKSVLQKVKMDMNGCVNQTTKID